MRVFVERDAGVDGRPVYRQIADQIREQVESGTLGAGDRLPAIRALAADLGVNRDTVALAYEALSSDGLLESGVGRGTFVASASGGTDSDAPPFEPRLSVLTERLLEHERTRARFGSGNGAVPMHALIPDPALYPSEAFRKALNRALLDGGPELLLYGSAQGHLHLRELLAERLRGAGIDTGADGVVLCHGASQGIALALRLFAQSGDAIALEEPTYGNVLAVVAGFGLETAPVPMRDDGLDLAVLERTLRRPDVKALYTIPSFHNPLGTSSTLAHRRALLAVAARCGKPVIEDGYQMDLGYGSGPRNGVPPPLAALDDSGLVVHLFSFSKSLFPGARVGAVTARGRLVDALVALKQASDLSDALPLQAALAEFIEAGHYERHLAKMRRVLRSRRDALFAALEREMPEGTRWTQPEGGFQLWVELPEGIDTSELLPDAVAAGALYAPGSQFNHDGRPSRCLRLAYAMADEDDLRRGVAALGALVRERLADARSRGRRDARGIHV